MHNDVVIMHLLDVKYCSMSFMDTHPVRNDLQPQEIPVPTTLHQRFWISLFKIRFQPYLSWSQLHTTGLKLCLQDVFSKQRRQSQTREILHHLEEREMILCFHNNLFKQQFMHTQYTEAET